MKYLVVGAALALLVLLAVWLPRKSVHAELVIDAPAAQIWEVIMDAASYTQWNPIFVAVEGTFAEGASMGLSMRLEDGSVTAFEVVVKKLLPEQELHQRAGFPGILTADHQWLLEQTPAGTRVIQHEEYRGIGVLFYDPSYVQVSYAEGLAALKTRIEGDMQ